MNFRFGFSNVAMNNAPDSNHESPVDGHADVNGAPSQLVPHAHCSSGSIDRTKKRESCYNRVKKERFIWSEEPQRCFKECLGRLPEDKQVPKRITEEMIKAGFDVTRENVASHLQKYRLSLRGGGNRRRNRGRPSSTSVPPNQEINSQTPQNGTSNFPNPHFQSPLVPNNPDLESYSLNNNTHFQSPLVPNNPDLESYSLNNNTDSHYISTDTNSHYLPNQRPFTSTNPNSYNHLQSSSTFNNPISQHHSFSTSPSSQSYSFSTIHHPQQQPMVNQLLQPFGQTPLPDRNMLQELPYVGHVGQYSDSSILEQSNHPVLHLEVTGQSSNAAIDGDSFFRADQLPPLIASNHQLVSTLDDDYNSAIHPNLPYNYSHGAPTNPYVYNMNSYWDPNLQAPGLNNMNLQFNSSLNFDDLQENDLQSNLPPPGDNGV